MKNSNNNSNKNNRQLHFQFETLVAHVRSQWCSFEFLFSSFTNHNVSNLFILFDPFDRVKRQGIYISGETKLDEYETVTNEKNERKIFHGKRKNRWSHAVSVTFMIAGHPLNLRILISFHFMHKQSNTPNGVIHFHISNINWNS